MSRWRFIDGSIEEPAGHLVAARVRFGVVTTCSVPWEAGRRWEAIFPSLNYIDGMRS